MIEQSGLTSGIMAEARKINVKHIDNYAIELRLIGDKALHDLLRNNMFTP